MTKENKIDQFIFHIQEINNSDLPEWEKIKLIESIKEEIACLE